MRTRIEEDRLIELAGSVAAGTRLHLVETADARSLELAGFCERLAALAPHIRLTRESAAPPGLPAIVLPDGVRYRGVPHGTEMEPFFEALAGRLPGPAAGVRDRASAPQLPATLEVFIVPHCVHCPQAVRDVMALASASPRIRLTVIDGLLFADLAEQAGIRAAPTLVLDGRFRWSGEIPTGEVAALIAARDPLSLGPASLEAMLKEGAARSVARMMDEAGALIPALLDLVCHEQWPVRLGAMVAVEELAAIRPDLAAEAIEGLWERFEPASDSVKGDILYLCGEVGGNGLAGRLEQAAVHAASPAVREAAAEAIEALRRKSE